MLHSKKVRPLIDAMRLNLRLCIQQCIKKCSANLVCLLKICTRVVLKIEQKGFHPSLVAVHTVIDSYRRPSFQKVVISANLVLGGLAFYCVHINARHAVGTVVLLFLCTSVLAIAVLKTELYRALYGTFITAILILSLVLLILNAPHVFASWVTAKLIVVLFVTYSATNAIKLINFHRYSWFSIIAMMLLFCIPALLKYGHEGMPVKSHSIISDEELPLGKLKLSKQLSSFPKISVVEKLNAQPKMDEAMRERTEDISRSTTVRYEIHDLIEDICFLIAGLILFELFSDSKETVITKNCLPTKSAQNQPPPSS